MSKNSKAEVARLRRELAHSKRTCREQQATIGKQQEQLDHLAEQIALLKKAMFGQRRERYLPTADQPLLFDPDSQPDNSSEEAEDDSSSEQDDDSEPDQPPPKKKKAKRKRFEFPQCLPVKRVEHPLSPDELQCPCGCGEKQPISEIVTKQLEYIPPSAYVLENVRFTYACPKCRDGEQVVTSSKPPTVNEKGVFGSGLLAYLAQAKYERHLPLYRLQEELKSASTMWFSRNVLSTGLLRTAKALMAFRDVLHAQLLQSFYVHADETTARVLAPGKGQVAQNYLWIYAGDSEHPYCLYDYRLTRSRAGPREILQGYSGGLLTDGHSAYAALVSESKGRILDLGCWAHGRREFEKACAVTSHALAHEAMAWIGQLYDLEDRLAESSFDERLRARQQEAIPILEMLNKRMDKVIGNLRPTSQLAKAIGYVSNRWDAMTRYTTDGRYAIDNNVSERNIRPSVIGRKNYLFFGNDAGAESASIWYTLIASARRNHVQVLPYLTELLTEVPKIVPEYLAIGSAATPFESLTDQQLTDLHQFLPDRWLQANPQHRAEERQEELQRDLQRRRSKRADRRLVKA